MLHVEVSRITGDPLRLDDAISYLAGETGSAVKRTHGSLADCDRDRSGRSKRSRR